MRQFRGRPLTARRMANMRQYRGGAEVSPAYVAGWVRVGRAPWPDRDVFTTAPPIPGADPTGIAVCTWDRKYRTYELVGGP